MAVEQWQAAEAAHAARIDDLTAGHRARQPDHRTHPVEDFLFTYYNNPPSRLRRWHPGPGVVLAGAAGMPRAGWTHYVTGQDGGVRLDLDGYLVARGSTVAFVRELLAATLARSPTLGCFGLHEWAMVHRLTGDELRHRGRRLRLGSAGTDEVVQTHQIRCSHFDAHRFFTPTAQPLNALRPNREDQVAMEQPGCLHAGMDVYKWCFKLGPLVPGRADGGRIRPRTPDPRARHARLPVRPAGPRLRADPHRDPGWQERIRLSPAGVRTRVQPASPTAARRHRLGHSRDVTAPAMTA